MSKRVTPSSTARRTVAIARNRSRGGPQPPGPVRAIAPVAQTADGEVAGEREGRAHHGVEPNRGFSPSNYPDGQGMSAPEATTL